jgi:hypothetical protein
MSATEEPIFTYQRTGFSLKVYRNRIEISDKSAFGAVFTGGKQQSILLRNVTDVAVKGAARKLYITTSDNKTHDFILGTKGEEARQAILSVL